ncbi:30S ribosome-binding factor RbfA [Ichthyobacterium seriolicida]|uniref:Ribosome-binding factor A n=1 Tax=Ichthyobacterium seriolicida TaxID=242600 RepID=A0A1J1E279_9FLAO|nr:30S ribosome-binding factor RbfA [Ichthyobacterium seriolicida]BAV95061.1 ribosome-binding factor A [Ichthyobacterium seriolicida]
METIRQKKIGTLLLRDLSEIIRTVLKDNFSNIMITVTNVYVTKDLSLAKVYISIFPSNLTSEIKEMVDSNKNYFKHLLSMRTKKQLRKTPDLKFYVDDSLDYIENIDNILKKHT